VLPADQIRALLREFDDPHRLERPRDFDLEASARRFAQLTRALVERFGPSCRSGLNQDTSDYGGISVPAEATGLGRPLWVGMSTFGCFVTAGRTSDSAAEISADIAAARGGRPLRLGGAASVPGRSSPARRRPTAQVITGRAALCCAQKAQISPHRHPVPTENRPVPGCSGSPMTGGVHPGRPSVNARQSAVRNGPAGVDDSHLLTTCSIPSAASSRSCRPRASAREIDYVQSLR
jgi:hypothetical protein